MGLLSEEPLDRWKIVRVLVKTEHGGAQVEGQVRYCKAVRDGKWRFRIGLSSAGMTDALPLFGVRMPRAA